MNKLESLTKNELLFAERLLKVVKNKLKADKQADIYEACRLYYVRVKNYYYGYTVIVDILLAKEHRLQEKNLVDHMWANRTPKDHSYNYVTQSLTIRKRVYLKKLQWLNNTLTAVRKELKGRGL